MKAVKKAKQGGIEDSQMCFFSARVPEKYKNHWKAEIAREGRSVKDVLIELFSQKYGLPR